jgi:predicted acetyltransferase
VLEAVERQLLFSTIEITSHRTQITPAVVPLKLRLLARTYQTDPAIEPGTRRPPATSSPLVVPDLDQDSPGPAGTVQPYHSAMPLILRPFEAIDEEPALAAHELFVVEHFTFLLGYRPGMSWPAWLAEVEGNRVGVDLPAGMVRQAFLAAEVDGELVGRVSIRFALNEWLAREGGHIGYGVLRDFRGRGYATEILRLAIGLAQREGVDPLLIVCDEDNLASATVIERCGGVLEGPAVAEDGTPIRRYWI